MTWQGIAYFWFGYLANYIWLVIPTILGYQAYQQTEEDVHMKRSASGEESHMPTRSPAKSPTPLKRRVPKSPKSGAKSPKGTPKGTPRTPKATPKGKKAVVKKDADGRVKRPYEFGGNIGCFFWTFFVPAATYYFYGLSIVSGGALQNPLDKAFWHTLYYGLPDGLAIRPTEEGFKITTAWILFQAALQQLVPGEMKNGVQLKNGRRLPYKLNGKMSYIITWVVALWLVYTKWVDPLVWVRNFGSCFTWSMIYSYAISMYLYVHFGLLWRRWKDSPEFEEDWGVFSITDFWHDFWMGTCRNPRIGHVFGYPFDFKFFFEARPGLILWTMINMSILTASYQGCEVGNAGLTCKGEGNILNIPNAMMIIALSQAYYIVDYFWHEEAILTTTDIRHEPFGFMLQMGDMGFLPWHYTNCFCLYLFLLRPKYIGHPIMDVLCACLFVGCMMMFRLTNIQKHEFRTYVQKHKTGQGFKIWGHQAKYVETREGSVLLTSGWWGMCRHPNYMPDLIMCAGWMANCAVHKQFPWVPAAYVAYFWLMDIHRFFRDEERCKTKYGADWERYVDAVPYCLIPGLV